MQTFRKHDQNLKIGVQGPKQKTLKETKTQLTSVCFFMVHSKIAGHFLDRPYIYGTTMKDHIHLSSKSHSKVFSLNDYQHDQFI